MKEYSLNKKFLLALIFLAVVVVFAGKAICMFLMGEITVAEEANQELSILIAAILFIVSLSYLYSVIMMIRQYAVHGGKAFTVTETGIMNTVVSLNLLAFIFVAPIKEIPWDAVKGIEEKQGQYTAKLDLSKVDAGKIAKLSLKIAGYRFCTNFISEDIGNERFIKSRKVVTE